MMNSHNYMRCKCSVCNKECLPLYTREKGGHQLSFCSEDCLKRDLGIHDLKIGPFHTCSMCKEVFHEKGVSDCLGFTYCSTYCAYMYHSVVQHIYEKGHAEMDKETHEHTFKERCAACHTECNPKYTLGYGSSQWALCSEQCLRKWMGFEDFENPRDMRYTCSKCGKHFWHKGVRYKIECFCSFDCACRYIGVAQYEAVTMDKEKEQEYERRIKALVENVDELQKMVYSLTTEVESKEKEIKRIRSKMDLSTLEPLLDKIPSLIKDGESIMDEMGENMAVLSILGLDEQISKLQDAIKATHDAGSELIDKIKEERRDRGEKGALQQILTNIFSEIRGNQTSPLSHRVDGQGE